MQRKCPIGPDAMMSVIERLNMSASDIIDGDDRDCIMGLLDEIDFHLGMTGSPTSVMFNTLRFIEDEIALVIKHGCD